MKRPFQRPNVPPRRRLAVLQELREANRLWQAGQSDQAAQLFAQLARHAHFSDHPRQEAQMRLRAAECFAEAGNSVQAISFAHDALNIILDLGNPQRAEVVLRRVTEELRARGKNTEAEALIREFAARGLTLPAASASLHEPSMASGRGRLPTQCPQCNAPVRSDEVEWIDDHSAECAYCGNPIAVQG